MGVGEDEIYRAIGSTLAVLRDGAHMGLDESGVRDNFSTALRKLGSGNASEVKKQRQEQF